MKKKPSSYSMTAAQINAAIGPIPAQALGAPPRLTKSKTPLIFTPQLGFNVGMDRRP